MNDPDSTWVQVAIPRPLDGLFTYSLPKGVNFSDINAGAIVDVQFGRSVTHGFVVRPCTPEETQNLRDKKIQVRAVERIWEFPAKIDESVLLFCQKAAAYYQHPLGEVLDCAFPKSAFSVKKPRDIKKTISNLVANSNIELTHEQINNIDQMRHSPNDSTFLLEGITGSGKTEIYVERIRDLAKQGGSTLVLVPEISLTPQLLARFESRLPDIAISVWHSAMSAGARLREWRRIYSGESKLIVGARSSVFLPIQNIKLIVVDEEHDSSYKQDDHFRYQGRDLAALRARLSGAQLLLGSATPSLESLLRVRQKKLIPLYLRSRPSGRALPSVRIVDLNESRKGRNQQVHWAPETIDAIRETVSKKEQVLVYLNRRGFAHYIRCSDCSWIQECQNCSISLTYYRRTKSLRCHLCGFSCEAPNLCPSCSSYQLITLGSGTESVEDELAVALPDARIIRLDRDAVTSHQRLTEVLNSFASGNSDILVGTQMVVKGHDFPGVSLVVVVNADQWFHWPDFRANERAWQGLLQVSGRAGRGATAGKVIIQTLDPEHSVLKVLTGGISLQEFIENELEFRKELHYPPYSRLVRFRWEGKEQTKIQQIADSICSSWSLLPENIRNEITLMGPAEPLVARQDNQFRIDICLKSISSIQNLHQVVRYVKELAYEPCKKHRVVLTVDFDPSTLA